MSKTMTRRLAALLAVSAAALATVATAEARPAKARAARPVTAATSEWGQFGVQTQWIDPAAKPGDDFDRHVNGKWNDETEIPADKTRIGAFITLGDLSEQRIKGILTELGAGHYRPGTPQARVSAAYKAYMDEAAIEAAGMTPVKPYLDRIQAAGNVDALVDLFAAPGYASPVELGVFADAKQSDRNAIYVAQGGLGLPDRDYYLKDDQRYRDIRTKYLDYLTFLLGKAGDAEARKSAESVLALETDLARETWDRSIARNRDLTYNKLTRAEIDALGGGKIGHVFDKLGLGSAGEAIVQEMPPTAEEMAAAKLGPDLGDKMGGGVPATLKLIDERPLAAWKAWLTTRFLSAHASFLPKDIDDANFAFYGTTLSGQPQQRERWKRGISAVQGQIGELLGQIYTARYFPQPNKAAMADLVGNLRAAMAANLSDLKWMGPETRKEANAKLQAFTPKIGAPDKFKTYDGLTVTATTPLANQIAAEKWQMDDQLQRFGKPVDRSEWLMLPQTVNAYYNPIFNEVVFPAAILQPPFFNLTADPAVNYGAIGAVIGHEMGHGFDDQGAKSDGAGNLRDWWTAEDKANFEALTGKLVDQYNQFCPFDEGKTCINGKLTLGENIGDLGGLSLAYRAYRMSLHGKEAPVIGGYTGDQRFFMSWAQVWRAKTREQLARQHLVVDPHSPPRYRINGIVRNFDEWYRAFNVQPDNKLYLPPEQRVRIW
ncbi:MAG: M13 family metallopeptidase [Novosphingobium sp.]